MSLQCVQLQLTRVPLVCPVEKWSDRAVRGAGWFGRCVGTGCGDRDEGKLGPSIGAAVGVLHVAAVRQPVGIPAVELF